MEAVKVQNGSFFSLRRPPRGFEASSTTFFTAFLSADLKTRTQLKRTLHNLRCPILPEKRFLARPFIEKAKIPFENLRFTFESDYLKIDI